MVTAEIVVQYGQHDASKEGDRDRWIPGVRVLVLVVEGDEGGLVPSVKAEDLFTGRLLYRVHVDGRANCNK